MTLPIQDSSSTVDHAVEALRPRLVIQQELCRLMERHIRQDGIAPTAVSGLQLIRNVQAGVPVKALYEPALCLLVQGRKSVMVGDQSIEYGPLRHLVVSHDLPVTGRVLEAAPERPYLCAYIAVPPREVAALVLEIGLPLHRMDSALERGFYAEDTSENLLDATLRLVRLLDTPRDIATLAPMIRREIIYRLLTSPNGSRLARTTAVDSHQHRIGRAIRMMRERYAEPLRIAEMASAVSMSESTFHAHFKALTALTPISYLKHLRLHEARRLLISERMDVATAGRRVGYESSSQFSREYSRLFRSAPMADRKKATAESRLSLAR
jgi:AraC-like DNA-binding protein